MRIEDRSGSLRGLCQRLFDMVQQLAGEPPRPLPDYTWYRADAGGSAFLYLRLIGEGARTYPRNSVHLSTKWERGNNWYGARSADMSVRADEAEELARAEQFIRRSFALYGGHVARDPS